MSSIHTSRRLWDCLARDNGDFNCYANIAQTSEPYRQRRTQLDRPRCIEGPLRSLLRRDGGMTTCPSAQFASNGGDSRRPNQPDKAVMASRQKPINHRTISPQPRVCHRSDVRRAKQGTSCQVKDLSFQIGSLNIPPHGSPTVGLGTATAVAWTPRVRTSLASLPAGTASWAMPR